MTSTAYLASSGDVRVVQELLGHESFATTAVYVKVADENVRHAALGAKL